ncbi:hypothetical protein [Halorubrum sp. Hd13]|uniref:hypothetical protein n=1 Tax=Halorubrum sp. Hd13 TaxID=1480728 RepID=UPI00114077F2|nr:hypothetical protein [Halorubrum sp. Hd13]
MVEESSGNESRRIIPETITVPYTENEEVLESTIKNKLQQVYGSGTYFSDFYTTDSGTLSVTIGNSFPKDVSDCRPNRNRVIKYIAVDGIIDISGERENEKLVIELPSRGSVEQGFISAKEDLRDELDKAMARATYEKIAATPSVENQLNPIKQILRWTRLYAPVPFAEVKKAQDKDDDKTLQYVNILEELGFVEQRDGNLHPKQPLEKYDYGEVQGEEFNKRILGEVVEQGFDRLSRDLQLGILRHLPKFANGYYLAALEVNDPELHLDIEAIQENMIDWYGSSARYHRFELRDKLSFLVQNDILEQEQKEDSESDLYFTANTSVFEQMSVSASL